MKRDQIIYWLSTILLCLIFTFSTFIHLFKTEMVQDFYSTLGFPEWIVIPNGILKVLAIIAILSGQSKMLKEWAYAGLFFDACLAFGAHTFAKDGGYHLALMAIILIFISRYMWGKLYKN